MGGPFLDFSSPLGPHTAPLLTPAFSPDSSSHDLQIGLTSQVSTSLNSSSSSPLPGLGPWIQESLENYVLGQDCLGELPIDWDCLSGTNFQKKLWHSLTQIPWGQLITYGSLARDMGHPGAARAVGSACGKNPILIVIPCHRVVGVRGLGGFTGGLELKRQLLSLEKNLKCARVPPTSYKTNPCHPQGQGPQLQTRPLGSTPCKIGVEKRNMDRVPVGLRSN